MKQANRILNRGYMQIALHQIIDTWQAIINNYKNYKLAVS